MIPVGSIGPWAAGIDEAERAARFRELRVLAAVYVGSRHSLTVALGEAVTDAASSERARVELSSLPALTRRRLLSVYGALL